MFRAAEQGDTGMTEKKTKNEAPITMGKFIACRERAGSLPVFRKQFVCPAPVRRATLYVTALGVHVTTLNGEPVGSGLLSPGPSAAGRGIVDKLDVTALVHRGENAIAATVASGWWSGRILHGDRAGNEAAYCAALALELEGGETMTVSTDESWRSARRSQVIKADIYDGEVADGRTGEEWKYAGYDDGDWPTAAACEYNGKLSLRLGPPIAERADLSRTAKCVTVYRGAVGVTGERRGRIAVVRSYAGAPFELDAGETALVDFGQNCAGAEEFTVVGERGTALTVRHGEILNDRAGERYLSEHDGPAGSLYTANERSAKCETVYTLGGGTETFMPQFTFYGFRYIEITATARVKFTAVRGAVFTSVGRDAGTFVTSDENVNKLFSCIKYSMYSNYIGLPIDEPMRDERNGWLFDALIFARSACYLGDVKDILRNLVTAMRDEQLPDGRYPLTVPTGRDKSPGGENPEYGAIGYADAGVLIPYIIYEMYGDRGIVDEHFESMERYVGFLLSERGREKGRRWCWGDWLGCEYDERDDEFLCAACRAWVMLAMRDMCASTGKEADAERYDALFAAEKRAFAAEFVLPDGSLALSSQFACACALHLGLLPDERSVSSVRKTLVNNIRERKNHISTGLAGTFVLLDALTEAGETKVAYDLLLQDTQPSWLHMVKCGATTIWERWNSYSVDFGLAAPKMNSLNLCGLGSIAHWLFGTAAGIKPAAPGFSRVLVAPKPDPRLPNVHASYDSAYGRIETELSLCGGKWKLTAVLPVESDVLLPGSEKKLTVPAGKHEFFFDA